MAPLHWPGCRRRRARTLPAIVVNRCDVRTANTSCSKCLKRFDAHFTNTTFLTNSLIPLLTMVVATPVVNPKQSARFAATLYSPPGHGCQSTGPARVVPGSNGEPRLPARGSRGTVILSNSKPTLGFLINANGLWSRHATCNFGRVRSWQTACFKWSRKRIHRRLRYSDR